MRESVIFSSENDNIYLYDAQHMFSVLMHPDMEKAHTKLPDADPYYLKKYQYLTDHGFWGKADPPDFETEVDEITVGEF